MALSLYSSFRGFRPLVQLKTCRKLTLRLMLKFPWTEHAWPILLIRFVFVANAINNLSAQALRRTSFCPTVCACAECCMMNSVSDNFCCWHCNKGRVNSFLIWQWCNMLLLLKKTTTLTKTWKIIKYRHSRGAGAWMNEWIRIFI